MRSRSAINIGVIAAFTGLCLLGLFYLAFNMGLERPGSSGTRIKANFALAEGLVTQDEVRIAGVKAGHVVAVDPAPDGTTLVTMLLDPGIRVRRDTQAVVRPKSLLGTQLVQLNRKPGSNAPYLNEGETIPKAQTGEAVEVDSVLNNMDPPTRAAFSQSLQELGVALDNRSGDVNTSIPQVDQVVSNFRPLAQLGDRRQAELARILDDLNIILQALADEQDQLGIIVDQGNVFFGGIAARDQQLAGALQNSNQFFGSLDSAFNGVTPADRQSLEMAPGTIAANQHTLSLTNNQVDQLIPAVLQGQVNYPNDQLTVTQAESLSLAQEWISAFAQHDVNGYSFRITNITGPNTVKPPSAGSPPALPALPGLPGQPSAPGAPPPPSADPLCILVGGVCSK